MKAHNHKGLFIAFEGLDGSGSSTQCEFLRNNLKQLGHNAYLTKEPTNNIVGGLIRGILTKDWQIPAEGLQLLFAADRSHHLAREIIPVIEKGDIIISDRYAFSSIAFGSMNLDFDWLCAINKNFIRPDITFLIKVSPKECIRRIEKSRPNKEFFEEEKKLTKTWGKYDKLVNDQSNKIVIIDGERDPRVIQEEILNIVKKKLFPEESVELSLFSEPKSRW